MDRTDSKSDTPLTQPGSGPVRYEIVDSSGNTLGPYSSLVEAEAHARLYGTDQDDGHWDVRAVGAE